MNTVDGRSRRVNGLLCRVLNSQKWQRMPHAPEEAYRCRRCGKRYYGKMKESLPEGWGAAGW
jgi:hypothetical protein